MAFANWTTLTAVQGSSAVVSASLDITTPIVGSGSLAQGNPDVSSSGTHQLFTYLNSNYNRGFTKGKLRSLVRFDFDLNASSTQVGAFFCFLCDDLDPLTTNAGFYMAGLIRTAADTVRPVIVQDSTPPAIFSDLAPASGTDQLQAGASTIALTQGQSIAMQVEWDYNLTGLGGVRIIMSIGNAGDTDFSNLAVVYDFVDSNIQFSTPVIEGLAYLKNGSSGAASGVGTFISWDKTGVFKLG